MSAKPWIRKHLQEAGVPFREVHHPDAFTAQQLAHHEHISGRRVAKVVIAYADGRPLLLVLPATHRVVLNWLRELTGARELRLGDESDLAALFPDCEIGAEPPLPRGFQVWMDESMRVPDDILFSAGTHRDAVLMPFGRWFELVKPRVGSFAMEAGRFPPRPIGA